MMTTEPYQKQAKPHSKKGVIPRKLRWHGRLAAWLIYRVIRGIVATSRCREDIPEQTRALILSQPVIFSTWHNRLALALPAYRRAIQRHQPQRRMAAMVSASGDGALVARVLELFGAAPVRGSSSRRGSQALRELITHAEQGLDLALTPDGPRGPRYEVQDGVIALAQLTGLPVIPASYRLRGKLLLRSWDRFQVPLPFASWRLRLGEAILVPREADFKEREEIRLELERRMRSITED